MLWGGRSILTSMLLAVESVAIVLHSTVSLYCTVLSTVYCTVMYCAWDGPAQGLPLYCVIQHCITQYSGLIRGRPWAGPSQAHVGQEKLHSSQYIVSALLFFHEHDRMAWPRRGRDFTMELYCTIICRLDPEGGGAYVKGSTPKGAALHERGSTPKGAAKPTAGSRTRAAEQPDVLVN